MKNKKLSVLVVLSLILVAWTVKVTVYSSSTPIEVVSDQAIDNQQREQNDENKDYSQQKIITLAPHLVELLFDLGIGDRIIGTIEFSDFPEQALNIPRVGNYAQLKIEKIIALEPDLIIAWHTGNPVDDLTKLEKLGIKVVYSKPTTLADVSKDYRLIGRLTGTQKLAEEKALNFEKKLARLTAHYANKDPITVFYELWSKPVTTVANKAWPQLALNVCGAKNPFSKIKKDYPQVNLEEVIIADPQIIIQPNSNGEKHVDAINWQKYPKIKASIHQQMLYPNADLLHRMSYRLIPELEKLCINIDKSRQYYQRLNNGTNENKS
ncbi:cobalamin-binding protein [Thalassomonas sp. M1454]|uniref:cobalamin-binding protein n=1 Tax=Thalassomonas sp. M1454 TaxID=2594477 RepID=UPI00163D947C|nr:cobalamin-binding protein [Thalassomonas sp. M1454]